MDVKLCLIKGNPKGKTVEVPAGTLKVGRAEDSDLIIASTRVSRHHCEVVNEGTRLVVRDKASANGTLVNGKKVHEQVLQAGDELQIGPLTFTVEINGVRQRPAATPPRKAPAAGFGARPQPQAAKTQQTPVKRNVPPGPNLAQPQPQPRAAPKDIAATLGRLAGGRANPAAPAKPPAKGAGDVLQISDEDLLDAEQ